MIPAEILWELTGHYVNERSMQTNHTQMNKMEKDPWRNMAIEAQFREGIRDYGNSHEPATLQCIIEFVHGYSD